MGVSIGVEDFEREVGPGDLDFEKRIRLAMLDWLISAKWKFFFSVTGTCGLWGRSGID